MQPDLNDRHVLVLGGTGTIGSAVLGLLARRGVQATFTFFSQADRARALGDEYDHRGVRCDLANAGTVRDFLASLDPLPDVVIHCAAISSSQDVGSIDDELWRRTMAVNAHSGFLVAQHLAAHGGDRARDIVLVGALDRTQSLPLPVHFAASQGMLSAMVMALGHELGPRGIRINLVSLGVMGGGLSGSLALESRKDYQRFSALRREGTPDEAAQVIVWLALENHYIQGKVIPVNGGI